MEGNYIQGEDEDIIGAIIGIVATIGLGILAMAIIDSLVSPKCPNCGRLVERNSPRCQNCYAFLGWR